MIMITEEEEKALREENAQLRALFDKQWKRSCEADALWRKHNPGNDNVMPDLGALLKWMMDRMAELEKDVEHYKHRAGVS